MLKNTAGQHVSFLAVATADGSPVTSGTPVVYLSKDGAAQATSTNTATHVGNGVWVLDLTQAETNADHLAAVMVLSTAVNAFAQAFPYVLADFKANVSGLSTFDPATDTVANVTLVGTCTTNTDMRGTDNASTFDPATDAVANVTLVGTCTTNTDMRGTDNASTFDPATDTVANVTLVATCTTNTDMRGTDNANTTTPLDAAATASALWDAAVSSHAVNGSFGDSLLIKQGSNRNVSVDSNHNVHAAVHVMEPDVITATALAASAVTEIQTGLITTGTAFTHTNQAGDTMTVTIT